MAKEGIVKHLHFGRVGVTEILKNQSGSKRMILAKYGDLKGAFGRNFISENDLDSQ
jgi:hypothetical protein